MYFSSCLDFALFTQIGQSYQGRDGEIPFCGYLDGGGQPVEGYWLPEEVKNEMFLLVIG